MGIEIAVSPGLKLQLMLLAEWTVYSVIILTVLFIQHIPSVEAQDIKNEILEKLKYIYAGVIGGCVIALFSLVSTNDLISRSRLIEKTCLLGTVAIPTIIWMSLEREKFYEVQLGLSYLQAMAAIAVLLIASRCKSRYALCFFFLSFSLGMVTISATFEHKYSQVCLDIGLALGLFTLCSFIFNTTRDFFDISKQAPSRMLFAFYCGLIVMIFAPTLFMHYLLLDNIGGYLLYMHKGVFAGVVLLSVVFPGERISQGTDLQRGYIRYLGHEIRTPLNVAVLGCELMCKDGSFQRLLAPSPDIRPYEIAPFQRLTSADTTAAASDAPPTRDQKSPSDNVLMQIRDSLTVATITLNNVVDHQNLISRSITLDRTFANVEFFCNECLSSLQPRASNKCNSFKINNYIDPLATMFVDKTVFARALSNLGVSALDLCPPDSYIDLIIDKDDMEQVMIILTNVVDSGWKKTPEVYYCSDEFQFDARELTVSSSIDQRRLDMDLGLFVSTGLIKLHGGQLMVEWCPDGSKLFCQFSITAIIPPEYRPKHHAKSWTSSASKYVMDAVGAMQETSRRIASWRPRTSNAQVAVDPGADDEVEISVSVIGNLPPKPLYEKKAHGPMFDLGGVEAGLSRVSSFNENVSSKSSKSISRNVSNDSRFSRNTSIDSRVSRNTSIESRISRNISNDSRSTVSRASSATRRDSRNFSRNTSGDYSPLTHKAIVRHALMLRDSGKDDLSPTADHPDLHLDLSAADSYDEVSRSPKGTTSARGPIQVSARSTGSLISREENSARLGQFLQGQVVLIVDDSDVSRKMTGMYLRKVGAEIHEACDGDEAVEKVRQSLISMSSVSKETDEGTAGVQSIKSLKYDFILMDYLMPNMNGDMACKKIRELGYTGVIMGLTGHALTEDTSTYLENGANTVMTKPLDIMKLHGFLEESGHVLGGPSLR